MLHASIPSPDVSSITLGPFTIHFYALWILLGIIVAAALTSRRLTARGAEPGVIFDFLLWTVPLGIIGARIFHVLTHPDDYFFEGAELWKVVAVWEGGIAIFGALLGGAVGAWLASRQTGVRFWTFADALAPGLLLAQAFGRLGNYFNHELFGQPTTLPWGLEIEESNPAWPVGLPAGTLFHPTFLYEILWNLAGVAAILLLDRRFRLQWGRLLGVYLIWYGLGRIVWESIRIDPSEIILGLRVNVWAAILAVAVGVVINVVQRRRHLGLEPSAYRPGREWVDPDEPSGELVDTSDPDADEDDRLSAASSSAPEATRGA
ncbi:prolipoprotein diacylglyceryl transferase [Labedella populi]|uniref:prolipoprotein diacylglyceryl transferase n=1 Tax=Labedella populi TaxID=2498850 RepID=UPI001FB85174|nr:prolipoprotein diacylglyceryl transferase [Labedella populi]